MKIYCNKCGKRVDVPSARYRYCEECREDIRANYYIEYREKNKETINMHNREYSQRHYVSQRGGEKTCAKCSKKMYVDHKNIMYCNDCVTYKRKCG